MQVVMLGYGERCGVPTDMAWRFSRRSTNHGFNAMYMSTSTVYYSELTNLFSPAAKTATFVFPFSYHDLQEEPGVAASRS